MPEPSQVHTLPTELFDEVAKLTKEVQVASQELEQLKHTKHQFLDQREAELRGRIDQVVKSTTSALAAAAATKGDIEQMVKQVVFFAQLLKETRHELETWLEGAKHHYQAACQTIEERAQAITKAENEIKGQRAILESLAEQLGLREQNLNEAARKHESDRQVLAAAIRDFKTLTTSL